jgi:hypothetical protein
MKLNSIFVLTFLLIILFSFIASTCTVGFTYDYILSKYSYEAKFNEINTFVKSKGSTLLSVNCKKELESIFEPLKIKLCCDNIQKQFMIL